MWRWYKYIGMVYIVLDLLSLTHRKQDWCVLTKDEKFIKFTYFVAEKLHSNDLIESTLGCGWIELFLSTPPSPEIKSNLYDKLKNRKVSKELI